MTMKLGARKKAKVLGLLVLTWLMVQSVVAFCHLNKPLPLGIALAGRDRPATEVRFFKDLTYLTPDGERQSEQEIFDAVFGMIDRAQSFVLVDMFLFNSYLGKGKIPFRELSMELTERLLSKKAAQPELEMVVITDPINTLYDGMESEHLNRLQSAGIQVVLSSVEKLRDSNPLYSSFWRMTGAWFGNSPGGLVPNPFGEGKVSLRSYGHLLNFKANHRKVIVSDDEYGPIALVTSANPHDGSSAHENVAIQFRGPAVADVLDAENAVLKMSGAEGLEVELPEKESPLFMGADELSLQVLSESRIKESVITALNTAGAGDRIRLVMFYFSDREIVESLLRSRRRGADVRVLLDPNRDAFGREKSGMPNRQVAYELNLGQVEVRWRETHGEQCHSKLILIEYHDQSAFLCTGSANYTRRNLDDFNLELNVAVRGRSDHDLFQDVNRYFGQLWANEGDKLFSVEYSLYSDSSLLRRGGYRVMEASGFCTF